VRWYPEARAKGAAMATTTTNNSRVVDGREVPPAGRWAIDTAHSQIQFVARHMMISRVRGSFREFSGGVVIGEDPTRSTLEVAIKAASIDTGDPNRDEHLRGPDFLDVERHPEIRYVSTSVRPDGDKWAVAGALSIKAVTREVTLAVEFCGAQPDPWSNLRAGFLATTEIDREDFDITWNQMLESGGFLVGKGVRIEIDAETVLDAPAAG
jgi:polyisoprenoid-binding protein YceI